MRDTYKHPKVVCACWNSIKFVQSVSVADFQWKFHCLLCPHAQWLFLTLLIFIVEQKLLINASLEFQGFNWFYVHRNVCWSVGCWIKIADQHRSEWEVEGETYRFTELFAMNLIVVYAARRSSIECLFVSHWVAASVCVHVHRSAWI